MVNGSPLLVSCFIALALLVAGGFVTAVRRSTIASGSSPAQTLRSTAVGTLATLAWLALTLAAAASGRLGFTSRPPTMPIVMLAGLAIAIAIATSRVGFRIATGVPLAALVGAQAFRFPLELMLHRAYVEGLMPIQVARNARAFVAVRIWNTAGIVLLVNIVTIAVLSAPTPIRMFHSEPANVFITRAPWVWLPSVFVVAAIIGHVAVYRRLRFEARSAQRDTAAASPAPRAALP